MWSNQFWYYGQDEILPMVQAKNLSLAFSSESSVEEELKRESTADAITILVRSAPTMVSYLLWHVFLAHLNDDIIMHFLCCFCSPFPFVLVLFQISYLVMFAYISLTLGDTPRFSFCYISSKVQCFWPFIPSTIMYYGLMTVAIFGPIQLTHFRFL